MYSSSRAAPPPRGPGDRGMDATVVVRLPRAAGDLSLSLSLSLARYTPRKLSLFSELSSLFPAISPGNFIILSVPLLHSAISISVNLGLLSGRPLQVADTRANTRVNIRGYGPETRGWSEDARGRDFLRKLETDMRVIRKTRELLLAIPPAMRLAWLDFLTRPLLPSRALARVIRDSAT